LIGRPVRSPNGEAVGEIADLVLSPADKVTSAVVSVGGFLGLGERQVEVPYDKLVVAADRSTVLVTMSKEELNANPEFSSDEHRRKNTAATATSPSAASTVAPPPAEQPDAAARSAASAEAAESFATDDPRVAQGIAENKEAFDDDAKNDDDEKAPPQ
jgi:sporulation protein YlmC with PRC-barrel domain